MLSLIQIVLIVLVSRAVSKAVTKIGQPQVVGEMITGILLRPSFLGQISPSAVNLLFPVTSMDSWAALILAFAFGASLTTEVIGVHALFGAFLAGVIIPPGSLHSFCKERFQNVASGFLLPLFFVFRGSVRISIC